MIGTFSTTDDNGRGLSVRFSRNSGRVKILGVTDAAGALCGRDLPDCTLDRIKEEIKKLKM